MLSPLPKTGAPLGTRTTWSACWRISMMTWCFPRPSRRGCFQKPAASLPQAGAAGLIGLAGLRTYPDLAFTLDGVSAGVDALVIHYRNEAGRRLSEVLVFAGDRVKAGYATAMVEG